MDKLKRVLKAFLVLILGCSAVLFNRTAAQAAQERIAVYVQVPGDWSDPCIWAWSDDGVNAFAAWPGGEMEADPGNEGWYYCWIPAGTTNIIINANSGGVQTGDYKIESRNVWVTVEDAETVTVSYDAQTEGEIPEYVETFKVHAQVPESWQEVSLWAWSAPDGKNAFAAWPGKAMKGGDDGWYTASVPVWVNSIIVNGNAGGVQTSDLSIDPAEIWVTVSEDGTADFTYNDPNAPVAEDITVHVKAPADWSGPCLWAWSAPDGTNAFTSWPGEALEDNGDGWYSLKAPGWINSVIVNGNGGSVQTSDLSVETGKDIWVVVTDAENAQVSYEKPENVSEPASKETESAEESKEPVSAPSEPTPAPAEDKGANKPLIITVIVLLAAALGAGGFVWYKKKK